MNNPILYRKRIIPDECIHLRDDIITFINDERIVTKWNTLRPKKDLHHGYSCYFLKEGFKVSRFLKEDDSLLYWYCDIVDFDYDEKTNILTITDLLADVIIYPDGFVKVVDIDELVQALDERSISLETLKVSLKKLDKLLNIIYSGNFDSLKQYLL